MADEKNNPFSVRMEPEDKEKLMELIQESGKSNKDFMSVLMSAYEINKAKVDIPQIAQDISHLEALTAQVNTIYLNMGRRIQDIEQAKTLKFDKDLELYKSRIENLQAQNEGLKIDKEILSEKLQEAENHNTEIDKQLNHLQELNEGSKALIQEYKEKNDTLTGLVSEYKKAKEENETIKGFLADEQARNIELGNKVKVQDIEIENLKAKIVTAEQESQKEIARVKDQKEFEKEKALLSQEKEFNKKLQELHEEYNNKVKEYQKEIEELNLEYNKKVKEYQKEVEELLKEMQKTQPKTAKTKAQPKESK